jgi:hypothetical protein
MQGLIRLEGLPAAVVLGPSQSQLHAAAAAAAAVQPTNDDDTGCWAGVLTINFGLFTHTLRF